ncbi:MAG: ferredoxin--NADP reductase [Chitinophagaceae bacterium]
MAPQPWQTGMVIRIEDATYNTRRFWIQLPHLPSFNFNPGQFVTLDLPIHDKPNKRWRSYSIASWPDGSNIFELLIVLLPGGAGSTYLFEQVTVGTRLQVRGPQGVFTLPPVIDKDLFFICTGTGIAPFRSMLHHIHLHHIPHHNIYLLFGTRTQQDLLYHQELSELQQQISDFQYIPTLSREQWQGCCGYVHPVYESLIRQRQKDTGTLPPALFYLCGWKVMIDEAKQKIGELGYDKKAIKQELYG